VVKFVNTGPAKATAWPAARNCFSRDSVVAAPAAGSLAGRGILAKLPIRKRSSNGNVWFTSMPLM